MKNFKVISKEDGREYWISRSMAVVGIVRAVKVPTTMSGSVKSFYLLSKRGKNCPDHVGKWQITCGYLDFDETLTEAVFREVYEETGLDIKKAILNEEKLSNGQPKVFDYKMIEIVDDPNRDSRQNVSFRFLIDVNYLWVKQELENGTINTDTESRGGEPGEVDDIRLVSCLDLGDEEYDGNFAFNHQELLESFGYDSDDEE